MSYVITGDQLAVSYLNRTDINGEIAQLLKLIAHIPETNPELDQRALVMQQFAGGHNTNASAIVSDLFQQSANLKSQAKLATQQLRFFYERFVTNVTNALDIIETSKAAEENVLAEPSEVVESIKAEQIVEPMREKSFYFRMREASSPSFMGVPESEGIKPQCFDIFSASGNIVLTIMPNNHDVMSEDMIKDCVIKTLNDLTHQNMEVSLSNMGVPHNQRRQR